MNDRAAKQLPDLLARIAEAAGEDAALLVAAEWGGRELYIPRSFPAAHRLVELLGKERARMVRDAIGHGTVVVPMGPFAGAEERRLAAARALADGKSQSEAAKQARVHVRTVERIAAKKRGDRRQGKLFA